MFANSYTFNELGSEICISTTILKRFVKEEFEPYLAFESFSHFFELKEDSFGNHSEKEENNKLPKIENNRKELDCPKSDEDENDMNKKRKIDKK